MDGTEQGMFGRRKHKERETTGPVVAAGPFTDDEADAVKALWRLTALPREEFDATYGELLRRAWRSIAKASGAEWTALRERTLKCAIAMLKVRQAHVLPRFAAAEDSSRLTEAMSFALAAFVVAERFALVLGRAAGPDWSPMNADVPAETVLADVDVPRALGALVLPRLVGDAGHEWLGQQPEALREIGAYFGGGPSDLRAIADDAAGRIGMPVVAPPPESGTPGENAVPAMRPAENDASATATGTGSTPAEAPSAAAAAGQAPKADPAPAEIGDGRVGWQWFNRARAGLRDGSVKANAEGGWLHNIGGSAFVVDPDCFEALAAAESLPTKSIRNRVLKLGRHSTRRSASGRADSFPADLADGRRVSGMVFPGELFWDKDAPPASKSKLR